MALARLRRLDQLAVTVLEKLVPALSQAPFRALTGGPTAWWEPGLAPGDTPDQLRRGQECPGPGRA